MKKALKVAVLIIVVIFILSIPMGCKKGDQGATTAKDRTTTANKTTGTSAPSKTSQSTKTTASTSGDTGDETGVGDQDDNGDEVDTDNTKENGEDYNDGNNGGIAEETVDFQGETIVVVTWNDPIVQEGISEAGDIAYRIWKLTEEKYNCKTELKVLPWATYSTDLATALLAGAKVGDLVHAYSAHAFPSLVKTDAFEYLDEYMENDGGRWNRTVYGWKGKTWYMLENNVLNRSGLATYATIYNSDMLQREGLEDIVELAKVYRWDWDNFLYYASTLTKDFDGDGVLDQWGVAGQNLILAMVYSNGISPITQIDNEFVVGTSQPAGIRALQFAYDLANVYKVVCGALAAEPGVGNFRKGLVAMHMLGMPRAQEHKAAGVTFHKVAPLPMGPDVDTYQGIVSGAAVMTIPKAGRSYEVKDLFAFYADAMLRDDPSKPEFVDVRTSTIDSWEASSLNSRENAEYLWEVSMAMTVTQDYTLAFNASNAIWSVIYTPVFTGKTAAGTAVVEAEPQLKKLIEDALQ